MNFVKNKSEAGATVLRIEGELDALTVSEIRSAIDEVVSERPPLVVLELGSLRLVDSSGVGALVSLYKRVRAGGGEVKFQGLRDQPLAIFKLLRLDRVLLTSTSNS